MVGPLMQGRLSTEAPCPCPVWLSGASATMASVQPVPISRTGPLPREGGFATKGL